MADNGKRFDTTNEAGALAASTGITIQLTTGVNMLSQNALTLSQQHIVAHTDTLYFYVLNQTSLKIKNDEK
jgi:hypothetical protein